MKQQIRITLIDLCGAGYHPFVTLNVNGEKCRFLLDTGASRSVLDKIFYEEKIGKEKLQSALQQTAGLHGSTSESYFGPVKEIRIGQLRIRNFEISVVCLNHVNGIYRSMKKKPVSGILGSDILMKHKLIIDYEKKVLR